MMLFPNNLKIKKIKNTTKPPQPKPFPHFQSPPDIFTYAVKKSLINATKMPPDARIKTFATCSP